MNDFMTSRMPILYKDKTDATNHMNNYLRQELMFLPLFFRLSVSMFVCLSVCVSPGYLKTIISTFI